MIRAARIALVALAGVVLGGGFYLLLIDTTSLPELIVLAGVAVGCGVTFGLGLEERFVEAALRPAWFAGALRLFVAVPRDIAILCAEAVAQALRPRAARGVLREAPFGATADTSRDTGRRAITETFGSIAPNTIVIGVDRERGSVLVHQLRPRGGAEEIDVMRLG